VSSSTLDGSGPLCVMPSVDAIFRRWPRVDDCAVHQSGPRLGRAGGRGDADAAQAARSTARRRGSELFSGQQYQFAEQVGFGAPYIAAFSCLTRG
jgi:hypothetical protein